MTRASTRRSSSRRGPARAAWPVIALLALVAGLVAATLSGMSTTESLELLGIPDPGVFTTAGLPAVRAIGELLCVVAIGHALFATFFTPPQKDHTLDVDGYRAQKIASWANLGWAACAALLIPLTLSDASGRSLAASLSPDQWIVAVEQIDVASSWRWAALLALAAGIGQSLTLTWRWSAVWLALSTLAIIPVAATGHASGSGAHDMATNSLLLHLLAAVFYVGGLVAVLLHALRGGGRIALALRRFSAVATASIVVLALSGVANTAVRLHPSELFTSTYGLLVVAKALALVALGILGLAMRRRVIASIASRSPSATVDTGLLVRIAGLEAVLMAVTVALAVSLGRTPPPVPRYVPGIQEALLGFQLPGPPTIATLLLHWRFDLILGTASVVMLALYLAGVWRLYVRGDSWPVGRTVAWVLGCVILLVTTSSGLGMYMMAQFSLHMVGHMLLSMLIPVLLCLGGPFTLALRALPAAGRANPLRPREWLVEFINNPVSRVLTHPLVAAIQFVAGFYIVYLAGFYDSLVSTHMGHLFMNVHFLISGYLFYWVIIGIDAAPRQHPPVYKLLSLIGTLPFHAFFGILLINWKEVLGEVWYRGLSLPWVPDLLHDQQVGGGVAWAAGEIPLFIVMLALAWQWFTTDMREARRGERQAARDDDAELRAYNEMLRQMSGGSPKA